MKTLLRGAMGLLLFFRIDAYRLVVNHLTRRMWRRARPRRDAARTDLCLAVDLNQIASLSQLGRDFIDMLDQAGLPYALFNMHLNIPFSSHLPQAELSRYLDKCTGTIAARRLVVFRTCPMIKAEYVKNIVTPFWEFGSGFTEANPGFFDRAGHVIAFSDFCYDYFSKLLPPGVGISKIRYPLPRKWTVARSRADVRSRYGFGDAYVVFFHFNLMSDYDRKNPDGVIRAFETGLGGKRAKLVIKTAGSDAAPEALERLRRAVAGSGAAGQIVLLDAHLSHAEVLELIASADVYLSLHRGEGFGIGMLEAMSVGVPVIATDYGGNRDFTRPETAFMVGYRMVPCRKDGAYRGVREWPEPDADQAAAYLGKLYADREVGFAKARAAKSYIEDYFSVENFAADVKRFLKESERD